MKLTGKQSPFTLLAFFLAPRKTAAGLAGIRQLIEAGGVNWQQLQVLAVSHGVTPLLYYRLKKDNLLDLVPAWLTAELKGWFFGNLARNERILLELKELLAGLAGREIPVILLKGAAALADDLYGTSAARSMVDVDLLVPPAQLEAAAEVFDGLGYQVIPDPGKAFDNLPTDRRHHHLDARRKPGSQLIIEIHYRLGYAITGDLLPDAEIWEQCLPMDLDGSPARILMPTHRLVHNTAHALVPDCEFIRGDISLQQLADFAWLVRKYDDRIDWQAWLEQGRAGGLETEFLAYLGLAERLMGVFRPEGLPRSGIAGLHVRRLLAASEPGWFARGGVRLYYYLNLPRWVWDNVCYTGSPGDTLARIRYLIRKAVSSRSRARI